MWELDTMTEQQIALATQILKLCEEYRNILKDESPQSCPFVWIENKDTGEFLVYTLGESRDFLKRSIGRD